jgi:YD repeat-containing protein
VRLHTNYENPVIDVAEAVHNPVDDNDLLRVVQNYSVKDPTGHSHSLIVDSLSANTLRSSDGSGYSVVFSPASQLWSDIGFLIYPAAPTVYDSDGISYSGNVYSTDGNGVGPTPTYVAADPLGNTIQLGTNGATDPTQRFFPILQYPDEYQALDSDTSRCPNLNDSTQPAIGTQTLTLPGFSQPFILCYTGISYHLGMQAFSTDFNSAYPQAPQNNWDPATNQTFAIDTIGGYTTLQSLVLPDGSSYKFLYDASNVWQDSNGNWNSSEAYGTIKKIVYPQGGTASFDYALPVGGVVAPVANYSRIGTYFASVSHETRDDVNGVVSPTSYSYSVNYFLNIPNTVNVTDPENNVAVHTFGLIGGPGEQYETQVDYYQGAATGTPLKSVLTNYQYNHRLTDSYGLSTPGFDNVLPSTITTKLNGTTQSTLSYAYPSLGIGSIPHFGYTPPGGGLVTTEAVSFLTPSSIGITDGSGNLVSQTVNTPQFQANGNYATKNLLTLTAQSVVGYGPQLSTTTFTYDNGTGDINQTFGNGTSVSKWLNTIGQNVVTSTISYDDNGMPIMVTDANGNKVKTSYQCYGSLPQTVIEPYQSLSTVAETTTYTYDCNSGRISGITDPNGVVTQYFYDSLGRITNTGRAVGTSSEAWTLVNYPVPPISVSTDIVTISRDQKVAHDGLVTTATTYDGFGRVIHQTDPAGKTVDTTYNKSGLILSVSNPHGTSSSLTDGLTSYSYDGLGRKHFQCNPDNGTTDSCTPGSSYQEWSYSGNVTTYYDETRRSWQRTFDPLARLTNVVEPGSLQTGYIYDSLGNLWSVTQSGNNAGDAPRLRSFIYDSLSRLTSSSNPENGTVTYTYDLNNNVHTKTDGRGAQVTYTYDGLDRLLSKTYSGASAATLSSCYQYNTAIYGIGRPGSQWTQVGSCPVSPNANAVSETMVSTYDPMGRPTSAQQCLLSVCSADYPGHFTYEYDLAGNLTHHSDGIGTTLFSREYDPASHLLTVTSSKSDATHPSPLFSGASYNPAGDLAGALYGTGLTLNRTYDVRLRIKNETDTGSIVQSPGASGSAVILITGSEQSK